MEYNGNCIIKLDIIDLFLFMIEVVVVINRFVFLVLCGDELFFGDFIVGFIFKVNIIDVVLMIILVIMGVFFFNGMMIDGDIFYVSVWGIN